MITPQYLFESKIRRINHSLVQNYRRRRLIQQWNGRTIIWTPYLFLLVFSSPSPIMLGYGTRLKLSHSPPSSESLPPSAATGSPPCSRYFIQLCIICLVGWECEYGSHTHFDPLCIALISWFWEVQRLCWNTV